MDFSKIEAGRIQLEKIDFDPRNLIESRISLIGITAHEKGLNLESYVDPRVPQALRGDSDKIGQVLLNLLNNAVKFTEKGVVRAEAHVLSLTASECRLKVSVHDSGIGLDPKQAALLFEPFVQADSSTARKYGGTGLGLSICKRIIEVMSGEIGIESSPQRGSIFWFTVPLEVSKLPSVQAAHSRVSTAKPLIDKSDIERRKDVHILVAEDNRINQMIVTQMLGLLGYSATLAENGRDAVELYQESDFDLILMDQHMPVMDGFEASQKIRQLEQGSDSRIPIIAFTATVFQDNQKETYEKLMDDFILKPVTLEVLENTLSKWEKQILS